MTKLCVALAFAFGLAGGYECVSELSRSHTLKIIIQFNCVWCIRFCAGIVLLIVQQQSFDNRELVFSQWLCYFPLFNSPPGIRTVCFCCCSLDKPKRQLRKVEFSVKSAFERKEKRMTKSPSLILYLVKISFPQMFG